MDIKLNDQQWAGLSQTERDNITNVVTAHFRDAVIVPHPAGATLGIPGINIPNPFCKPACDVAQAAAVAACSGIGSPIAVAACIAAAQAAGDACRSRC